MKACQKSLKSVNTQAIKILVHVHIIEILLYEVESKLNYGPLVKLFFKLNHFQIANKSQPKSFISDLCH